MKELEKALDNALNDEPKAIDKALDKAKKGLDERQRELAKLADEVGELKEKLKNKDDPLPEDVKKLEDKKEELKKIADNALGDISPDKNLNVLGDPKGDKVRQALHDIVDESWIFFLLFLLILFLF